MSERDRLSTLRVICLSLLLHFGFLGTVLAAEKEFDVQQKAISLTAQDKGRSRGVQPLRGVLALPPSQPCSLRRHLR